MAMNASDTFASLLRRHRGVAGLTQEQLAEQAHVSARAVSDLERGSNRLPRLTTVHLLATALRLSPVDHTAFLAAAQRESGASPAPAPAAAEASRQHNAPPRWLTELIGRDRDVAEMAGLLQKPELRLITITGPGGVGKTRLAAHIAAAEGARYADGACWVDLTAARSEHRVVPAIAHALGVRLRERDTTPLQARLAEYLRTKHMLLVLDNCEQVVAARTDIVTLLTASPWLTVLATSRVPLRVRGERLYRLSPLALPADSASPETVEHAAAVTLFLDRARDTGSDVAMTPVTAPSVANICRRLDGLPLAIELAAAWTPILTPAALLAQLDQRLVLLVVGTADNPARQQTMRDAIAWSYDLLEDREQVLFRRMSVFVGGCTLAAAEQVCRADDACSELSETMAAGGQVREALLSLVAQNLVHPLAVAGGETRFGMLETIREFAAERLLAEGTVAAMQARHARYFLTLAEREAPMWPGVPPWPWLDRLELEHENLRAAWMWTMSPPAATTLCLRLVGALLWFWYLGGHYVEGRAWSTQSLAYAGPTEPSVLWARALLCEGLFAALQGDGPGACAPLTEAAALYRARDDERGAAYALIVLGLATMGLGQLEAAFGPIQESVAAFRAVADQWGEAYALYGLGNATLIAGRLPDARACYDQSLALWQTLGDTWGVALLRSALGNVAMAEGNFADAATLLGESAELFRAHGVKWELAQALIAFGAAAVRMGQVDSAARAYSESIKLWTAAGNEIGLIMTIAGMGAVAATKGQFEHAAQLFGAAEALTEHRDAFTYVENGVIFERMLAEARAWLRDGQFAAAWVEGRGWSLDTASASAVE